MYLALLGLAAMGLLGTLFAGSSDGDAGEDDATPEPGTPDEPDSELPDVTVTETETGALRIELAEDVPASVVTLVTEEPDIRGPLCCSSGYSYEANVFVLPEGFDMDAAYADYAADPNEHDYDLVGYLESLGVESVASVRLGSVGSENSAEYYGTDGPPTYWNNLTALPEIETDLSVTGYVYKWYDTTEFTQFDPSETNPYDLPINGTEGDDDLVVSGVETHALAGNDTITGSVRELNAGDGDDLIHDLDATVIYGQAGDDTIDVGVTPFIFGGEGNDVIRMDNSADYADPLFVEGGAGDDYIVGMLAATLEGGEGNDTLTAIHADADDNDVVLMEGGDGADTFQVTSSVTGTIGGTIDDPELLASISDFDPLEDVLVLSSNLPGPVTPTYSDGTLLLELGDGSFASVALGIDSFDVSAIVFADVEAGVEAAFAS